MTAAALEAGLRELGWTRRELPERERDCGPPIVEWTLGDRFIRPGSTTARVGFRLGAGGASMRATFEGALQFAQGAGHS